METPKEKLKKITAWDVAPELTDVEIDELLSQKAIADTEGTGPASEDWVPTYDINSAAAAGWLLKAGRAASTTETEPDSVNVTSRVFANCLRMSRIYAGKRSSSVKMI
ncbi:MAG: hypothetical protein PSX80_13700 [bacterium]|nr:hypothetical protein [bacterium]